jgi:hypothetical protein
VQDELIDRDNPENIQVLTLLESEAHNSMACSLQQARYPLFNSQKVSVHPILSQITGKISSLYSIHLRHFHPCDSHYGLLVQQYWIK